MMCKTTRDNLLCDTECCYSIPDEMIMKHEDMTLALDVMFIKEIHFVEAAKLVKKATIMT